MRLRGHDDQAALARWLEMKRSWPAAPLAHEVDVEIVATLLSLGRAGEARAAATSFLRHYPSSPRAEEMRAIATGSKTELRDPP
jgi:hypothetical protein